MINSPQNSELSEYKNKVGELKSENDYQLRLKDMNYGEKIKELKETHSQEMEALRAQYEVSRECLQVSLPPNNLCTTCACMYMYM